MTFAILDEGMAWSDEQGFNKKGSPSIDIRKWEIVE